MQCEREITEQKLGNSFASAYIVNYFSCKNEQTQFHSQKINLQNLHLTTKCSGKNPDASHGLTVCALLSPMFTPLFFILLDLTFSQYPAFFYRRTKEYWENIVLPEDNCVTYP